MRFRGTRIAIFEGEGVKWENMGFEG